MALLSNTQRRAGRELARLLVVRAPVPESSDVDSAHCGDECCDAASSRLVLDSVVWPVNFTDGDRRS
jgi:hypothetical protein